MKKNVGIFMIYACVGVVCAGILGVSAWMVNRTRQHDHAQHAAESVAIDTGHETRKEWFEIANDLSGVNQDGQAVKLSDLRGKVWLVAEFFAVCPRCATRNGAELHGIYDEFKNDPDFHLVCITVDPENDKSEKLTDYAKALGANTNNWWFMNAGDVKTTHTYLEQELKFFGIRERTDPLDIESNGRYAHDMGFILVDRDFKVVGKWPLTEAGSEEARKRDPELYERTKKELYTRIREELGKTKTAGN